MVKEYKVENLKGKIYLNDPFFRTGNNTVRRAQHGDDINGDKFLMAIESSTDNKVRCAGRNDVFIIEINKRLNKG